MRHQQLRAQVQLRPGFRLAVGSQAQRRRGDDAVHLFHRHRGVRAVLVKQYFDMIFAERHQRGSELVFPDPENSRAHHIPPALAAKDNRPITKRADPQGARDARPPAPPQRQQQRHQRQHQRQHAKGVAQSAPNGIRTNPVISVPPTAPSVFQVSSAPTRAPNGAPPADTARIISGSTAPIHAAGMPRITSAMPVVSSS